MVEEDRRLKKKKKISPNYQGKEKEKGRGSGPFLEGESEVGGTGRLKLGEIREKGVLKGQT